MPKAVVLLSGGLDSATCLRIAQDRGFDCYCLSFDYHQRHDVELNYAKELVRTYRASGHVIFPIAIDKFKGSALTDPQLAVPDYQGDGEIPITYVPARNTIFLSVALAYAEVLGAQDIFIGSSQVDYSGYPDCRQEFFDAFSEVANLATKQAVSGQSTKIHTPLIRLSKAETITAGLSLGMDYSKTVSCYQATSDGLACGVCDSCVLRRQGFIEAGVEDPTRYC